MYPPNAFIHLVNKHFLRTQGVCYCIRGSGEGKVVGNKMQKKQRMLFSSDPSPYICFHLHIAQPFCGAWVQSGKIEEKEELKSQPLQPGREMSLDLHADILLWGSPALTCRVRRCIDKNILAEMALSGRLFSNGGFFFIMANCVFTSGLRLVFPSSDKRLKGTETARQSATALFRQCG